jgi:hypothetical protein
MGMPFKTLKRLILPHDELFFELMLKQAETAQEATQVLCSMMRDYKDVEAAVEKMRDLEHKGDQLVREVYSALHSTFIVPMDHGDISQLTGSLDDVVDIVDHTAEMMVTYRIAKPTPPMVQLSEVLMKQAGELQKAVAAINNSNTFGKASEHCREIKRLETEADDIYNDAIGEVFRGTNAIEIIKQKDVLFCLETATDKVDKAAQIISDITIKHA